MMATSKRWPKGTWMKLTSGDILRAFMDQRGVSNADLGMAAGVGRSFISALVNERRTSCTPRVAERIERRLGVPSGVIFTPKTATGSSGNRKGKAA